jgi:catechol 2,3-dioxygenase-like lactoylglutathione lyase family enzyme
VVSIRFYTEILGLSLTQRFGNHWVQVEVVQLGYRPGATLPCGNAAWQYEPSGRRPAQRGPSVRQRCGIHRDLGMALAP